MKRILLIVFMFVAISSQAQVIKKKISDLPTVTTVTNGTNIIAADSSSDVLKSITVAQLDSGIVANAVDIGIVGFDIINTDTVKLGTYYILSDADSVWIEKPLNTWVKKLVP